MRHSPYINEVIQALESIIRAGRAQIDAALDTVVSGYTLGRIMSFASQNIDIAELPCIMLEQNSERMTWEALQSVGRTVYAISVIGVVHHDDEQIVDDLISVLAGAVRDVVNSRHAPILIRGARKIYFDNDQPLSAISYGSMPIASQVMRSFVGTWNASAMYQIQDPTLNQTLLASPPIPD